jgi:hypothetical protein
MQEYTMPWLGRVTRRRSPVLVPLLAALTLLISSSVSQAQTAPPATGPLAAASTIYLPLVSHLSLGGLPPGAFKATFDGTPASPQTWNPTGWDVAVHSRDVNTWEQLEAMPAMHGADCGAPPATHTVSNYEDAVFQCRNHVMTAIQAGGYGVIYLTPNQMVDFSRGEAVIRWDMSTLRTSMRDYVDVWITPYEDNLELPFELGEVDLTGAPRNAIQVRMDLARNSFFATRYENFDSTPIGEVSVLDYSSFLTPDAARRDTFELRISNGRLRFGMPAYNAWWVNSSFAPLDWTQGVVQFGHHSYNPLKDCSSCQANTWHWDNVLISPAVPFTMIHTDRRAVERATPSVTLERPAPANANLRFAGIGDDLQVSFDGGKTWQAAQMQKQDPSLLKDEHFKNFWMPIPAGTRQVRFRGQAWWGADWLVRDVSVWAAPA